MRHNLHNRLLRLIKALGGNNTEIVGRFYLTDELFADSIEYDINEDIIFNVWIDEDMEIGILCEDMEDVTIDRVIKQLEKILLN